ncbi:MAG TPA: tetratricopeptide repeat protein, partial [Terriglobales bacterium]|nr:tetratricopeptide repeat protein [Terriglobales bacterium]
AEPDDTPEPEPEIVASIPKSESLLPRLAPGLPPNQAAAIRVIEEGRKLIDANQYDQATDRLERGVSIDPANPYGYYYLARVKYLKKEYSQAVAFAGRAVALSARTDRKWVSRAYTLQAEIFEEVGRYRDARTSYGKAMQADPSNLSARVGSARLAPVHDNPGTE